VTQAATRADAASDPTAICARFSVRLAVAETCMKEWEKQLLRLQVRAGDVEFVGMRMFRSRKGAFLVFVLGK
jgi:hypothetical protein